MKTGLFIFWLLTAYTIVFAHSIVPHHHDKPSEAANHSHQHHHEHSGQNTHHHSSNDHDNDSHDLQNALAFFQHQGDSGEQFLPGYHHKAPVFEKQFTVYTFRKFILLPRPDEGPPLNYFTRESGFFRPQQERFYFNSVKAPPVLS